MNPTFGDKVEGAHYQTRYGVYAVIPNQEKTKIILVQAPNGAWFLPGGEIEAGEDHYSALERELIEELGFTATLMARPMNTSIQATVTLTITIQPIFMKL